jgi:hypothetical protein
MLKGIQLTLLMGPVVPIPAPREVVDALQSVQVTVSAGARSGFQLDFAISKASPLNRERLPAGFFNPFIRVILVVSMGGLPTVLIDGVVTRHEVGPSNEPGQSTLTVTGEDLTALMDLEDLTGRASYPAMPWNLMVMTILAKYAAFGILPAALPPLQMSVKPPTEKVVQHKGTDLAFVKALATNTGYTFYLIPGPVPGTSIAYWGPDVRVGIPQPALSVNLDAETNVESLRFTYDGLSRKQLSVTVLDPIFQKVAIPIPIPNVSLLKPPLAAVPAITMKREVLKDTAKKSTVEALLQGLSKEAEGSDAITGSGSLDVLRYGRLLSARGLVGVRGAGLTYDGLYFVASVTHTIKRGEYKQSFTLSRDGTMPLAPAVNA